MKRSMLLLLALATVACRKEAEDLDEDGVASDTDCDDNNAAVFPGADEICDGLDNDCDTSTDEEATDAKTWFADADNDGSGNANAPTTACEAPAGFVEDSGDCDDIDAARHPGADESDCTDPIDYNCDGSAGYADGDADGYPACKDCDDDAAAISPAAIEICNGSDDDCDGSVDDNAANAPARYEDADADGYGDPASIHYACDAMDGYVDNADDCDPANGEIAPGKPELCNDTDDNCNAVIDEQPTDAGTWYADADGDGVGGARLSQIACDAPAGYVASSNDCDDLDADTRPGAPERCDGEDNDCDSALPVNEQDVDNDTFLACQDDCNDNDAAISPDGHEVCGGGDEDCDGLTDESDATGGTRFYADGDGDGYGMGASLVACAAPSGWVADNGDCDDEEATAFPGAIDDCDGIDNDCDGVVDPDESALGEAAACPALHCSDLLERRPDATDGAYWLSAPNGAPYVASCDMTTDGGGWTLALKVSGTSANFLYDSPLWTDTRLVNRDAAAYDRVEAKLQPYLNMPFSELLLEVEAPVGSGAISTNSVQISYAANHLRGVFAGGYVATTLGRDAWKSTVAGSSLQTACNREGFNVNPVGSGHARVRLGIVSNNENDCLSPDSWIGLGGYSTVCSTTGDIAVGNASGCLGDNGDVNLRGFGWLSVRCEPGADDVGDGRDQSCDYVDGIDADHDGEASVESGGADCDDADPTASFAAGTCEVYATCYDILLADPSATDGVYRIQPEAGRYVNTWCDMTRGGWTLGFVKNSRHTGAIYGNSGAKFGAGYVGNLTGTTTALNRDPAATSTSTETRAFAGWLDMNNIPASHIRLSSYANGAETFVSDSISVGSLRLDFGNNGYYLYNAPASPARSDAATYYWCGGDRAYTDSGIGQISTPSGAPADCKGHGSLGSGWDFSRANTGNTGLTLCGGAPDSTWMYSGFATNPVAFGNAGAAQAVWFR